MKILPKRLKRWSSSGQAVPFLATPPQSSTPEKYGRRCRRPVPKQVDEVVEVRKYRCPPPRCGGGLEEETVSQPAIFARLGTDAKGPTRKDGLHAAARPPLGPNENCTVLTSYVSRALLGSTLCSIAAQWSNRCDQFDMVSSFSRKCSLGAIFVSYRRSDSQGEAGRLFDDLVKHFGERMVFMDVAGIEAGRDFRKAIEESVAQCGALLVVMGPEWLNAKDESGARRLDDPADFVRIETGSALRRDIPVIPVLVHGASMPHPEQLPEGIKDLAYRNCIELTHARWKSDIQLLVEALRRVVVDTSQHEARTRPNQSTGSAQRGMPSEEVRETPKLEHRSSAQIDAGAMQRVSRELALLIGPIADIMVKRAASRCTSIEDLYLKVSEEIESRDERDTFLRRRGLISSAQLPEGKETITLPTNASETPASIPPSGNPVGPALVLAATKTRPTSTSKYLLLVGGAFVLLILVFFLVTRFTAQRETDSFPNAQTSTPNPHPAEYAPADSSTRPPVAESSLGGDAARGAPDGSTENRKGDMTAAASTVADQPRVRISENVSTGLLISKVLPVYPLTARQARVQGTVVLQAAISKDGTVEALRVASGHPFLIPPAIEAVKQWRYKPYMVNGKPRPVDTEIMVDFVLKNQ